MSTESEQVAEQQNLVWKEGAIWLRSYPSGLVTVSVERDGQWVEVIRDHGGLASHIVEPGGINDALRGATGVRA